jgi:hypothetical protein
MAKDKGKSRTDIDWILRDRKVIDGLDHLGIELVSVNLYQAMLPGITNVTERARYYSFYPWTVHRYAQDGPKLRTRAAWRNWFRALDFTYAVACMAYEQELGQDLGSAVVGADRASLLVKGQPPAAKVDLHSLSAVEESGAVPQSGFYFKNPEGGLGQYYKGPLRELGVLHGHSAATWPDVQLSNYAGKRIAQTLDHKKAFEELKGLAIEGRARIDELGRIGKAVHPAAIEPDSEEATLLRQLFFGDDPGLCQGQQSEHIHWRRTSLLLMLQFLRESGVIDDSLAYEFRWSCMANCLPDGRAWTIPEALSNAAMAWGAYQRNDLLNYCLECLFYAGLQEVDLEPRRPAELVKVLADRAMAGIAGDANRPALPALPRTVADWITATRLPDTPPDGEPWGPLSTWALADRLGSAVGDRDMAAVPALSARLLGRLATDRGRSGSHPFAPIPNAVEMASNHEVHLRRWWDRAESRSSESTGAFLEELLLEWVIYRHLRVATRKLANQGVSTFKYRPEEGRLLLVAERLPLPTYTAPRVKQGFRVAEDLHCIRRTTAGVEISEIGKAVLEAHHV